MARLEAAARLKMGAKGLRERFALLGGECLGDRVVARGVPRNIALD